MNGVLNESTVGKEYNFNRPDIHEIEFLLDDIINYCRSRFFHIFEYRVVYNNNFTNISNKEEIVFTITHRTIEFKRNSMI